MAGSAIVLRFVNRSSEVPPPSVVLWQPNDARGARGVPVAWKVIRRCGFDCTHPIRLPRQLAVRVRQGGGSGPAIAAAPGTGVRIVRRGGGLRLEATAAADPTSIEVRNLAGTGAVDVEVLRGGRPIAIRPCLAPLGTAVFRFPPSLVFSAVEGIAEGDPLWPDRWLGRPVEIPLLGVVRADVVMTGGGGGSAAIPLLFHLCDAEVWPV